MLNRSFTAQLTAARVPLRIRVTTARRPALLPPLWSAKIFSSSAINLSTRQRCLEPA
jgi:hypothetical protein